MNYYYEVNLNFNEEAYSFYEWSNDDKLEHIKKIPLVKIKSNIFKSIVSNKIKVSKEFILSIKNRTMSLDNNIINACIFCDTKNCIAIEFDNKGVSIARSNLLLEDENNICEISYSLKTKDIKIEKINGIRIRNEFRQETKIKRIIFKELEELYKNNDINKLQYLYYEWFNKLENDKKVMIDNMKEDLQNELSYNHFNIYKIIKLSYNKV